MIDSYYRAGTLSVTAGSTAVVLVGAAALSQVKTGDTLVISGTVAVIDSVTDNLNLVLADGWPGATVAASADYLILRTGAAWSTTVVANAQLAAIIAAIEAGLQVSGALSVGYVFSSTTADADPGTGQLRLDNATQNAATTIRADLADASGISVATLLDQLTLSSSSVKSLIRLFKTADPSKWLTFQATSQASPAGYRNISVSQIGASSASPFVDGDVISMVATVAGDKGSAGAATGFPYAWSTSTTAVDPSAGKVKVNHATPASATLLFISETDGNASNIAAEIATWDDSTSALKGRIKIADSSNQANFVEYDIAGALTDNGAWVTVPVVFVASGGTMANNAACVLGFTAKGDKGEVGSNGSIVGIAMAYSTGVTDADPGAGTFRFNNATISSVTAAYVDNLEAGGASITAWLDALDDTSSASRSILTFRGITTPTAWASFIVTGAVVDGTGYRKLNLVHIASGGVWANGASFGIGAALSGNIGSAGGAISIPYVFSTTTTDADPGNGFLRLSNLTQNIATVLRVDLAGSDGSDWTGVLDTLAASTNPTKAMIRVFKTSDPTKWLLASMSALASPSGYRNLSISVLGSSSTNPFANGDAVMFCAERIGNKGDKGDDGNAATLAIGTVESVPANVPASVTNSGTDTEAILNFEIPAGLDGFLPGRRFAFSTTTTDVDPGAGTVAFNHGTIGSVTTLFIDNEESGGADVTAWLDSFDDSTNTANRGSIFMQHGTDIASFAEFVVTGAVIDGSGYRKIPVTPVGGAGAFTNGAPLVLSFTRTGNKGADGLGAGDVVGPAGATDGAIALFNGTTGKLVKDSGIVPSAFGLSLLDDINEAGGRSTLGLVPGTDVQAYHASLAALASITVSAAALTLLDDPNTAAMLTTLGALPLGGGTMTGALTLNGDPSAALHAATKQYVDNVAAGLDPKASVRLATTTNDTLSGLAARDGVTPVAGNRVLVKAQTTAAANGIYVAASGAWARATDMDNWLEVPGANVWVEEGTANGDTAWVCVSNAGGTLGSTAIDWTVYGGTGVYQPSSVNLTLWAALAPSSALAGITKSVRDFGATGDGSTDDTAAITAAITAAGAGGAVYYPTGAYIVSDDNADGFALIQLSGQRWYGDGPGASILRLAAATTTINVVVTAEDFATDYSIENMQIDGNRANITPGSDLYNTFYLVRGARGAKRVMYRNLLLSNSWGRVLQTSNESVTEYAEDILIDGVWVSNAGTKAISATQSRRVTISNCFAEVNPYAAANHPWAIGDGNAASGSCYECNDAFDVTISGNHGIQTGTAVVGPGIRLVDGSGQIRVFGNTIEAASYLGFIQNTNDIDFFSNTGRGIRGNGILIADANGEDAAFTCKRIRVHQNTIIDPTGAYISITANKSSADPQVECYIYDNDFVKISGTPTHGIYNNGVASPATGGTCLVYQWRNKFTGSIPNQFAGAGAAQIQNDPVGGWQIVAQSSVAASVTGTAAETALATIPIPANRMGANGRLRVTAHYSYTNSANNKITRVRFGGSQATAATGTTTAQQRWMVEVSNRNSLSAQSVGMSGINSGTGVAATAATALTIATTSDQNITLTAQLATTTETITLESYVVELFYAL